MNCQFVTKWRQQNITLLLCNNNYQKTFNFNPCVCAKLAYVYRKCWSTVTAHVLAKCSKNLRINIYSVINFTMASGARCCVWFMWQPVLFSCLQKTSRGCQLKGINFINSQKLIKRDDHYIYHWVGKNFPSNAPRCAVTARPFAQSTNVVTICSNF